MTPRVGVRDLYGGRHLRTTLVLALTSAAAGGLTGAVGVGVAGTPASHDQPTPVTSSPTPKHRHAPKTQASILPRPHSTAKRSTSPTPTLTQTVARSTPASHPATSAPPAASPTSAPTTPAPAPSDSAPPTGGASPPSG